MVAEAVPKMPCSLLVPSAATGGNPASSRAGMVISPPPPAIESTKPAAKAAKASMMTVWVARSSIGISEHSGGKGDAAPSHGHLVCARPIPRYVHPSALRLDFLWCMSLSQYRWAILGHMHWADSEKGYCW